MTDRTAVSNLHACWASLEPLLVSLDDDQWAVRSLCPDWTVQGVVTHLAAVEHVLAGWRPTGQDTPLPFDGIVAFGTDASAWTPAVLLDRFQQLMATRLAEITEMSDEEWTVGSPTPVGPGTYGRFMEIRVFDFWVHEQDIRVPLGLAGGAAGPAAEMAIDEIQASMGYIAGKRVGLEDGRSLRFELTGPVARTIDVRTDGRARVVDDLTDPDATITTDSTTFALLACGRIDPQDPVDDGRITWTGDAELGDRAARNLRFTM